MKFGSADNPEDSDLSIPAASSVVDPFTQRSDRFYVYVGCANWNKKNLKDFFPQGVRDELAYYSTQFNSIELNATYFKIFPPSRFKEWYEKTPEGFLFFPKILEEISHVRRMHDFEEPLDRWMESVQYLEDKLGVCFLQAHNNFGPEHFDRVEKFVKYWTANYRHRLAIEMRHTDWHNDAATMEKYYALLEDHGVANIITDTAGRRDLLHMRLTTPTAFIRFVGCDNDPTDFKRLEDWAKTIGEWAEKGLSQVYFFVYQHVGRESPKLAAYFIEMLNKAAGLSLEPPTLFNQSEPTLEVYTA